MTEDVTGPSENPAKAENQVNLSTNNSVPIDSLSRLTGFPKSFIKKELLLNKDSISMEELRESVLNYLESVQKS